MNATLLYAYNNPSVIQDTSGQQDVTHELELEFIDTRILAAEKRKQAQGEPSEFASMVEVFLDNARILSKRGGRA